VESVAVRAPRVPPREMPLMVELASSALPIDPEGRITFPPEIVRPESEERPDAEIPPANVDVAVEEELIPPPA